VILTTPEKIVCLPYNPNRRRSRGWEENDSTKRGQESNKAGEVGKQEREGYAHQGHPRISMVTLTILVSLEISWRKEFVCIFQGDFRSEWVTDVIEKQRVLYLLLHALYAPIIKKFKNNSFKLTWINFFFSNLKKIIWASTSYYKKKNQLLAYILIYFSNSKS